MHRYLAEVQADYEAEALDVSPQRVMTISGEAAQDVHEFDDGSQAVVEMGEQVYFDVELQWTYLTDVEREHITDLYFNPHKARGRKKSFYWPHPTDDYFYTVYFRTALRERHQPGMITGITSLTLRVVGIKPTWE